MNLMTILGLVAGTLTTVAFLPQLIKAWKSKSVRDVSLSMVLTYSTGAGLWLIYGWSRHDWPIIFTNLFGLIFNLTIGWFKIKYK
ncbi:MAG: SemiSWEET family sugar transporter [Chroococcidiopsidaceae cyanobacterium CP_BM_RX_35]|nr:SemiSWEET family sugar transporter [Chroococcidiopsidaceae cyanobacterium CP_BM_RX_35]